jgi:hypothetical protein
MKYSRRGIAASKHSHRHVNARQCCVSARQCRASRFIFTQPATSLAEKTRFLIPLGKMLNSTERIFWQDRILLAMKKQTLLLPHTDIWQRTFTNRKPP